MSADPTSLGSLLGAPPPSKGKPDSQTIKKAAIQRLRRAFDSDDDDELMCAMDDYTDLRDLSDE